MSEAAGTFLIPCRIEIDEDGNIVKAIPDSVHLANCNVTVTRRGTEVSYRLEKKE